MLLKKKATLSTAESCTGGMISTYITSVPGSSSWFTCGIIAYSNNIKVSLLDVPEKILAEHGAVSAEVVTAMAHGAVKKTGSDCSIAVSGIAGPGGGTKEKPVGLVYIGINYNMKIAVYKHIFNGNREEIREQATYQSLSHLTDIINQSHSEKNEV